MKNHITVDQFKELTDSEKKIVQDGWKPEDGDWYYKITTVKLPDGLYDTHEDIDVIHDACAGEFGEGVNIMKQTNMDKDGTILIKIDVYPLLSVDRLVELLGSPLMVKWNSEFHGSKFDVSFVAHLPDKLTILSLEESIRLESADELCDALWRAYLVRLRS
jgi:hypothetical protein